MTVKRPRFENLPERISRLGELSYNLWWSWTPDARLLFRQLDRALWRTTSHNPVRMLKEIPGETLALRSGDAAFLSTYDRVMADFDRYMSGESTWYSDQYPKDEIQIAYFCFEFGLHSSLPIYSGGLGLLAGDTCKEASDLGLPFVAIGYFYPEGYFRQTIESDGRQEAHYVRLDTETAPILRVLKEDGGRFVLPVRVGDKEINVSVWKVQAGRVPIFLLDTDIAENEPWDRDLSARLYGGDRSVRLRQEIMLGMGGLKVLKALGYHPTLLHLNEGHAAFATLQLLHEYKNDGRTFSESVGEVQKRVVFTTHTPVQAGHDSFPLDLIEGFFRWLWTDLGVSREEFLELGRPSDSQEFCMTVLALRLAGRSNGVSEVHGGVSRRMWQSLWPDKDEQQVPIRHITNGVHVPTWIPLEMGQLFAKYLGADWLDHHDDPEFWSNIGAIPDDELWYVHRRLKYRLMRFVRYKIRRRWMASGLSTGQVVGFGSLLDPDVLTVGFARRFASYKRGDLIFRDRQRLHRILHNRWRPVQIIFAGKAHPEDEPGKYILQEVFRNCMSPEFGGRVAFIEEYNQNVGHQLVQGVDVWLNNPRPPLEASGTSGQKSSLNGVPNLSVLDGWWQEGFNGKNGWAIDENTGLDDEATANAIYDLLEKEIVPAFYERDANGIPLRWLATMKEAIRSSTAPFSSRRMLKDYLREMYLVEPNSPRREA